MIDKALEIATLAHQGQFRKGTKIPYILHPLEAGIIAASLSMKDGKVDQEVVSAAILHDLIEDTYITYQILSENFNEVVIGLIQEQSEDKSKTWQERKETTIRSLENNSNINLEIVTMGDKLSNLRSIHRDYQRLGDQLWERFTVKDKKKHQWYYSSISKNIKQLKDTEEYQEYEKLLKIFNDRPIDRE